MPKGVYVRTSEFRKKASEKRRTGDIRHCLICNKELYIQKSKLKLKEGKFCSRKCDAIDKRGKKFSIAHKKKLSIARKKLLMLNPLLQAGRNNSCWKGGTTTDGHNYILIYQPDHPYKTHKRYVYEHRLIVEKHLGRYLKPEEVVHHMNRIKSDNRPKNLMAFVNHSAHRKFENGKQKIKSKEIIFDGRDYQNPDNKRDIKSDD